MRTVRGINGWTRDAYGVKGDFQIGEDSIGELRNIAIEAIYASAAAGGKRVELKF